jgi:hypothetical protein
MSVVYDGTEAPRNGIPGIEGSRICNGWLRMLFNGIDLQRHVFA